MSLNFNAVSAQIKEISYHTFPPSTVVCHIETYCGWVCVGSATPARTTDFDEAIGKRNAFSEAFRDLTNLERFYLRRVREQGNSQ